MMTRPSDDIIRFLAVRVSYARAAEFVGVHKRTFAGWARELGCSRLRGRRPTPLPPAEVVSRAAHRYGNHGAAGFLGVSYKTFCVWLSHYGLEETKFDSKEMLSLADAAREFGVTRAAVSKWFRDGKLPGATKINRTRVMIPRETITLFRQARGA